MLLYILKCNCPAYRERVLEAVRGNELYIFTHPDMRPAVEMRFAGIMEAFDRAEKSEALKGSGYSSPQDLSMVGRQN